MVMLDKFWESISSNLADRWLEYVFGPAFLFWFLGLGIYFWHKDWETLYNYFISLSAFQQGIRIAFSFLILIGSSIVTQSLRFPVLRFMEGYWVWPFNYLTVGIAEFRKRYFQSQYSQLRKLKDVEQAGKLKENEIGYLMQLEQWAHWNPVKKEDLLPTAFGNILRAREQSPERKYGLDAMICWPRLWFLLPENVRSDLEGARISLDRLVELWFWGLLFLVWAIITPWAIALSLIWMFFAYSIALQSAKVYGELLEAAFDLYRLLLYDASNWARPTNIEKEKEFGKQLTEFLWRGTPPKLLVFVKD